MLYLTGAGSLCKKGLSYGKEKIYHKPVYGDSAVRGL